MVRVAGYDEAQIANAAIIADVARSLDLGDHGALLGVMCAMGESSLRNIDYGDWETSGVRNPDGTPTTSIGLFQQQASWGSVSDRMDPLYAAWRFFDALSKVRGWRDLAPTVAIHRVQINADPNHYAKYETPARAVLAAIPDLKASGLMAPTIEWLRPGVGYQPAAARSMRRLEARLGRAHDCNSSYRDYDEQMQMYNAWNRYVNSGYDSRYKPNHSRALHPDKSVHCMGLADDSDDWTTPGYIDLAAEHGWIRTAANDPTERHHFEYQVWNDQHRNDPTPAAISGTPFEEDDMYNDDDRRRDERVANFINKLDPIVMNGEPGVDLSRARLDQAITAVLDLRNRFVVDADGDGVKDYDLTQLTANEIKPMLLTLIAAVGRPSSIPGAPIDVAALAEALREGLSDEIADELSRRLARGGSAG